MNLPIIGQEAVCPDGLGRVVAYLIDSIGGWIQVATYVNNREYKWDVNSVQLVKIEPLIDIIVRLDKERTQ